MTELLYKQPIPGIPIFPPEISPMPDDELVGYRVVYAPKGFFCKPDPPRITTCGWLSIVLLTLLFWPASCLPCCMSSSYMDYQVPVYSPPTIILSKEHWN